MQKLILFTQTICRDLSRKLSFRILSFSRKDKQETTKTTLSFVISRSSFKRSWIAAKDYDTLKQYLTSKMDYLLLCCFFFACWLSNKCFVVWDICRVTIILFPTKRSSGISLHLPAIIGSSNCFDLTSLFLSSDFFLRRHTICGEQTPAISFNRNTRLAALLCAYVSQLHYLPL